MKRIKIFTFVLVAVLVLAACKPAAETTAPEGETSATGLEVCEQDRYGCAKIEPGQTIKIGMGSPMTGGDASFGIDAEQSG